MKKIFYPLCLYLCFSSCMKKKDPYYNSSSGTYTPVIMKRAELEKSIAFLPARDIKNPAKIYTKGSYLFISERYEGVHVIDNTNPVSPINKGFIGVPGCVDMAIKNNTLYVDNAVDLVSIDLSDPSAVNVTSRTKNVFPALAYPDQNNCSYCGPVIPQNTIIVKWVKK
jgi:hypothetical protein